MLSMTFKIYTGADVTVIPETAATPFKSSLRSPMGMLHEPAKVLSVSVGNLQERFIPLTYV